MQRWRMVCFNSVQRPNRHAVHHSGAVRTEQRATLAAAMLGAPADDTERRMGSGATWRGSDSAMPAGLRVARGRITDRVPPRYSKSVRRCTPGRYVGPISCVVRTSVRAADATAAAHWTGVLRDSRGRAKRQMDGPGDYRHATVRPRVHWNLYCPVYQRRVASESVQRTEVHCVSAAATTTAPYRYLLWTTRGVHHQSAASARSVDGADGRHDGDAELRSWIYHSKRGRVDVRFVHQRHLVYPADWLPSADRWVQCRSTGSWCRWHLDAYHTDRRHTAVQ